jgi:hypothetical protein
VTERYRAVARFWHAERGDEHWHGRWRPERGARAQADRWRTVDYVEEVWLERLGDDGPVREEEVPAR